MSDQPIPGLEPDTGRLDARYARFLGTCKGQPGNPGCGAPILWATSAGGNAIPVDVRPTERGNLTLTVELGVTRSGDKLRATVTPGAPEPLYLSHHATCPHANRHRKARR